MRLVYNQPLHLWIILALIATMMNACAFVRQDIDGTPNADRSEKEARILEDAIATFEDDDFGQALPRFEQLGASTTDERIKQKARLGEICSRLMLAETQAEFTTAVDMWRDFIKTIPSDHDAAWALPLIDPLIVRMAPKMTTHIVELKPRSEDQKKEKTAAPKPPTRKQDRAEKKLPAAEKAAQNEEELQNQVQQLKTENQLLKEKIKALEAIDQNIQKKKTELSAPGE